MGEKMGASSSSYAAHVQIAMMLSQTGMVPQIAHGRVDGGKTFPAQGLTKGGNS
jgi:hypothetical protein